MGWNNLIKIVILSLIIQQCWGICNTITEPEKGTVAADRYCGYDDYLVKGCDKCKICINDRIHKCKFGVHINVWFMSFSQMTNLVLNVCLF